MRALAQELVGLQPDIIVTDATPTAAAHGAHLELHIVPAPSVAAPVHAQAADAIAW
jgi:hypothetical protein